jgi:hypothetical protein
MEEVLDDFSPAALRLFADYAGTITWWPVADVVVEPWRARLAARGFEYDADTPGMAVDLAALDMAAAAEPDLEIRRVASARELQVWGCSTAREYVDTGNLGHLFRRGPAAGAM